jgi:hypothetical protein
MPRGRPPQYAPLADYLAALTIDEVRLTFPEIEAIIATTLPVAAYSTSFWWSGAGGVLRVQPWVRVGWRVVRRELHRATPAVTFARIADTTP